MLSPMMQLARSAVPLKNTSNLLRLGSLTLQSPCVMGIVNVTPDSFSDGGNCHSVASACRHAETMATNGADIIDVGGESTRPGATTIDEPRELDRILPVVEALQSTVGIPISVDTCKATVMREAVAAGAHMINDVSALRAPGALQAAADLNVPVCLMHMRGNPQTMQQRPEYEALVPEVMAFLQERVQVCVDAGVNRSNICVDPGFGFGKTHADNVELLANLRQFRELGLPLLVGLSRKSLVGEMTGKAVDKRIAGSVAAAVVALTRGADIVRVHDVDETVDALKVVRAIMEFDE